jgi:hypothetical protein
MRNNTSMKAWFAGLLCSGAGLCAAVPAVFTLSDPQGTAGRCAAPVSIQIDPARFPEVPLDTDQLLRIALVELDTSQPQTVPAQAGRTANPLSASVPSSAPGVPVRPVAALTWSSISPRCSLVPWGGTSGSTNDAGLGSIVTSYAFG